MPALVAQLKEDGHFIESADGKFYAYANTNRPAGPSEIRVLDAATGRLIATGTMNSVVGRLHITEDGIASKEADAALQLRVPLRSPRRSGASDSAGPDKLEPLADGTNTDTLKRYAAAAAAQSRVADLTSNSTLVSEYNELRSQYVRAIGPYARATEQLKSVASKSPTEDLIRQEVERARPAVDEVERLLQAKLRLLEIDRRAAVLAVEHAKAKLAQLTELHNKRVVPTADVRAQQAEVQAAELSIERAETIIELFESIRKMLPSLPDGAETGDGSMRDSKR
jgi:hypothetical protein